jgi:tetratricopeptide (TPR) repeat protein
MSGEERDLLKEAEQRGDADALYELAGELEDKGDDTLAEEACLAAAKLGHALAADSYAHVLYERDDKAGAAEWWSRAAEAGDAESAFNAGVAYEELGRQDDARAWYRKATSGGHAPAYANLGSMLEAGGDVISAEDAYRSGAEAGDSAGAYNLGMLLYRHGDDDAAREAFEKAAALGDEDAAEKVQLVDRGGEEPDDYDREAARVLVEQANADPDTPTPVEHWLYLPGQEPAERVAVAAGQQGFAVQFGPSTSEDGQWVVRATRHMLPRPEIFARARHPLIRLVNQEDGEYDGWEAPKAV